MGHGNARHRLLKICRWAWISKNIISERFCFFYPGLVSHWMCNSVNCCHSLMTWESSLCQQLVDHSFSFPCFVFLLQFHKMYCLAFAFGLCHSRYTSTSVFPPALCFCFVENLPFVVHSIPFRSLFSFCSLHFGKRGTLELHKKKIWTFEVAWTEATFVDLWLNANIGNSVNQPPTPAIYDSQNIRLHIREGTFEFVQVENILNRRHIWSRRNIWSRRKTFEEEEKHLKKKKNI